MDHVNIITGTSITPNGVDLSTDADTQVLAGVIVMTFWYVFRNRLQFF